jgi:hypothetical protein
MKRERGRGRTPPAAMRLVSQAESTSRIQGKGGCPRQHIVIAGASQHGLHPAVEPRSEEYAGSSERPGQLTRDPRVLVRALFLGLVRKDVTVLGWSIQHQDVERGAG